MTLTKNFVPVGDGITVTKNTFSHAETSRAVTVRTTLILRHRGVRVCRKGRKHGAFYYNDYQACRDNAKQNYIYTVKARSETPFTLRGTDLKATERPHLVMVKVGRSVQILSISGQLIVKEA